PRLAQLRAEVLARIEEQRRLEERRTALEKLPALDKQIQSVDIDQLRSLSRRAREMASGWTGDEEFSLALQQVEQQLSAGNQAAALLQKDRSAEALALCTEQLASYPEHVALSSLK